MTAGWGDGVGSWSVASSSLRGHPLSLLSGYHICPVQAPLAFAVAPSYGDFIDVDNFPRSCVLSLWALLVNTVAKGLIPTLLLLHDLKYSALIEIRIRIRSSAAQRPSCLAAHSVAVRLLSHGLLRLSATSNRKLIIRWPCGWTDQTATKNDSSHTWLSSNKVI